MGSRFASSKVIDSCYNPVRISKNGIVMYVPCGKCNGCLLRKANMWSFRIGDEIENTSYSIFCTLTYSNRYVPKLQCRVEDGQFHWFSAPNNYRFDGARDKLRDFVDFYSPYYLNAPLKNYHDSSVIGYLSKSDIQLFLKILRKKIYEKYNISKGAFRYYIVGEYGPGKDPDKGKYRPHFHCLFFPCNSQIAEAMLRSLIYESWKMCDQGLFEQYTKFCDSGTRHYVTEYVTGVTSLPKLLRDSEIKPFFLSSKEGGAMGTCQFDRKKVCQDIERGIIEYSKRVERIESNYIFLYPKAFTDSLFPKCSRYSLLSFDGLLRIYEYLFNIRQVGISVAAVFNEFCDFSVQDYTASKACLKVCDLMSWTPYHYLEVLDDFYYIKAMRLLRYQYEFQQSNIDNKYLCIGWYSNWELYLKDLVDYANILYCVSSARHNNNVSWFLGSFGLDSLDSAKVKESLNDDLYCLEVDDIIRRADKSKKVNSVGGLSPHIV